MKAILTNFLKSLSNNRRPLYIVIVLALVLRLVNLNQSLWLDEAAQAIESAGSLAGLFKIYADFMPPLFHLLLHFWMMISKTEVWMRLLSVVFGLGTICFTYLVARKLFSPRVAILAAALLAISPFHIFYSQELRPYALMTFLAVVSTHYLIEGKFLPYTVAAIFFIYSFYIAPLFLVSHGVYLLVYNQKIFKKWLAVAFGIVISFLPWLPVFLPQLHGGSVLTKLLPGWSEVVSVPLWKVLPLTLAKFMLGRVTIDSKFFYALVFAFIAFTVSYLVWRSWRVKRRGTSITMIFIAVPLLGTFLISLFLPIIAPQRLLFILPFFLMILASGVETSPKKRQIILASLVILPNLFGLFLYFFNPRFQREQWRQATIFVQSHADRNTEIIFAFPEPFAPFLWYRIDPNLGKGVVKNFIYNSVDAQNLTQLLAQKKTVYFFGYLGELTDPHKNIPATLAAQDFHLNRTYDFPGVGFIYEYYK